MHSKNICNILYCYYVDMPIIFYLNEYCSIERIFFVNVSSLNNLLEIAEQGMSSY